MKEFLQLMRRFVSPYKKYIGWAILLNILSAVFNVFSFTFLIPILSILFKTEGADKVYHFMEWGSGDLADVAKNNFYYYISQMIVDNGPTVALIFLGLFLMVMTLFKTGCYFASSAVIQLSLSVSASTFSTGWPVCSAISLFMRAFVFRICSATIFISVA